MLQIGEHSEGFFRRKFVEILVKLGYDRTLAKQFVRDMAIAMNKKQVVHMEPTDEGKISIWFERENPGEHKPKIVGVVIPPEYLEELYLKVK